MRNVFPNHAQQFGENASHRPNIDLFGVVLLQQDQFRCPVPSRDDVPRKLPLVEDMMYFTTEPNSVLKRILNVNLKLKRKRIENPHPLPVNAFHISFLPLGLALGLLALGLAFEQN